MPPLLVAKLSDFEQPLQVVILILSQGIKTRKKLGKQKL